MSQKFDPTNPPKFVIPEDFLEKLYGFTGGTESGSGFILSYVDESGKAVVYTRASSQIIEMGLRKALEQYLIELEEGEISIDQM